MAKMTERTAPRLTATTTTFLGFILSDGCTDIRTEIPNDDNRIKRTPIIGRLYREEHAQVNVAGDVQSTDTLYFPESLNGLTPARFLRPVDAIRWAMTDPDFQVYVVDGALAQEAHVGDTWRTTKPVATHAQTGARIPDGPVPGWGIDGATPFWVPETPRNQRLGPFGEVTAERAEAILKAHQDLATAKWTTGTFGKLNEHLTHNTDGPVDAYTVLARALDLAQSNPHLNLDDLADVAVDVLKAWGVDVMASGSLKSADDRSDRPEWTPGGAK